MIIPSFAPTTGAPDPNDIGAIVRARALLVSLEITTWSARKLDKRVTAETNAREGADVDASRTNKHLLGGKVDSHSAVIAAAGAARTAHYGQTLPWSADGSRMLPVSNYYEYAKMIREARDAFKIASDAFLAEYPSLQASAARRLGGMFNHADYPDVSEVACKFAFRVAFLPIPAASDIRIDLPPEITAGIERSITSRVNRSVQSAVSDGWERLAASVERIRDRLNEIAALPNDGPSGRLHASLFESAVETAETLRRLNVLGDPNLETIASRIIAELAGLDPKQVRKDPDAMADTAARADAILTDMRGFYGRGAT